MSETSIILDDRGEPFNIQAGTPDDAADFWYGSVVQPASSGLSVTPESAIRVSAVMACVRVLAETVASLPLILYRRLPRGGKERATDHPLYGVLHDSPNSWQTSFDWREYMMGCLTLRGNAYSEIIPGRNGTGSVAELVPLHPDNVSVEQLPNRRLRYKVRESGKSERILTQDQVFRVTGLSLDGITGISPISRAREAIGLAMATEQYGASLFGNKAMPGGVLETEGRLSEQAVKNLKATWGQPGLSGAHKTAILQQGLKFHPLSLTNKDSQFIEARQYQVTDIARIFRVPPHMIGDLERATFSNVEQQAIDFVVHSIRSWLVRWEQAISRDLIGEPSTSRAGGAVFAEFLVDGLLRGDIAARTAALQIQLQNGALTDNEWRDIENRNPFDGGDQHFIPMNMTTIKKLGEEEDEPEPEPVVPPVPVVPDDDESDEPEETATTNDNLVLMIDKLVQADRSVFTSTYGRLVKMEHDRSRAARKRGTFDTWLAKFIPDHATHVRGELIPIVDRFCATCRVVTGWDMGTDEQGLHENRIAEHTAAMVDRHIETMTHAMGMGEQWHTSPALIWEPGREMDKLADFMKGECCGNQD